MAKQKHPYRSAPITSFARLHELGWPDLLPIIPPDAKMHPNSKIPESARGKSPGVRTSVNGEPVWMGLGQWRHVPFGEAQANEWEQWEANLGIRCNRVAAIDSDITDAKLAQSLHEALMQLDTALKGDRRRYGAFPKWTWIFRVTEPIGSWRLRFRTKAGVEHAVEILGDGKQTVISGIHPRTKKPYVWSTEPTKVRFDEFFQLVKPTFFEKVKAAIEAWVVEEGCTVVRNSGASVGHWSGEAIASAAPKDQTTLWGEERHVLAALEWIGTRGQRLEYDEWIKLLITAKAACAGTLWEDRVRAAFIEMSERLCSDEHGDDPVAQAQEVERRWAGLRGGPFLLGADWVYGVASGFGWNRALADAALMVHALPPDPHHAARMDAGVDDSRAEGAVDLLEGLVDDGGSSAQAIEEVAGVAAVTALAGRFAQEHVGRSLLYAGDQGCWYVWEGARWQKDGLGVAPQRMAFDFVMNDARRLLGSDGVGEDAKKGVRKNAGRAETTGQVVLLARPRLAIRSTRFDAHPWVINTPEGPVDLRTGDRGRVRRADLHTKQTGVGVAEKGTIPFGWTRFLGEITQGDEELVAWLQRAVGYTLAGVLDEQVTFFLYGPGGNGKSVFLNVLRRVLGDYAATASGSVFVERRSQEHPTSLAVLQGARMVQVPEMGTDEKWNVAMLKRFSAGDPIKARFMRMDEFEFVPQGTLWFAGNDRPAVSKVDAAIERRMRFVGFNYRPEKPDLTLERRLVEHEGAAILRWAVEGARMWVEQGLGTCRAVEEETNSYFAESDPIRAWIDEECLREPSVRVRANDLWLNFQRWYKEHMTEGTWRTQVVDTQSLFGKRLAQLGGMTKIKSGGVIWYRGIRPKLYEVSGQDVEKDDLTDGM